MSKKSWKNKYGVVENGILKEFTVDRAKWLCGEGKNSVLLNGDGERCCIGFMAAACNVPDKTLLNKMTLRELAPREKSMVLEDSTDDLEHEWKSPIRVAYRINDDQFMPLVEKETALKKFFREVYDVSIIFKGRRS